MQWLFSEHCRSISNRAQLLLGAIQVLRNARGGGGGGGGGGGEEGVV